jgi:outer membrane protein OmpA-like peptidoglycan-associated protein
MPYHRGVRWILLVMMAARVAAADPVSLQARTDVPAGQKPMLEVRAVEALTDLRLELDRNDGKHFSARHPALAKGQAVTLPIGDGAAGKASYHGKLSAQVAGSTWSNELTFDTIVRAAFSVGYDADHLDLDTHVLEFRPSRGIREATLEVFGEDGSSIGKGAATYRPESTLAWFPITWTQPAGARVMTMKLRVVAADGAATNVELVPWSVVIDHADVNFATDSAVIEPGEAAKLDASLAKIVEIQHRADKFMKMKLYVAGHTDTVGPAAKNKKLSFDRAVAIAQYFKNKGLAIPIAVAGFGEDVLKVKTADETDERANRRADYVLGPAAGAPPFKGPYLKVRADWKQLR